MAGELGGVAAPRVRVLVVRQPAATCPHVCLILTTPDQSCKRRFPKIALIFQNHGKCPLLSLLLLVESAFTFMTLLRHYANQVLTQGK